MRVVVGVAVSAGSDEESEGETILRFTALLTVLGVLCCIHPIRSMAADLPDVLWSSVQDQQVTLQLEDGTTLTGALTGFDDTSAVLIQEDGSVLAVQRSDVASIKLAEAPASANALPPATGTVSEPAPPIEPEQTSAAAPEPVEMPIEVKVKVDELHAEINALNKGSASVGIPGVLLAAGGFAGFIVHHYKLKSANHAFEMGNPEESDYNTLEDSPGHRTGFAIMMVGGFCMVIPALVMEKVARVKSQELAGIEAQYATAGLYDVRLLVAASPEAVTFGVSARF